MNNGFTDTFGRRIDYLRLSVTDQCDLRCFYCMPQGFDQYQEPENWLTFDEIERVVAAFARLDIGRIRLTGGEPLLRRDLARLASRLHALPGIDDLSLSTNAVRLAKQATALRQAGVSRLNISLDTLRPERFKAICGGKLEKVLAGIEAARNAGFGPIKLNMVVMRGINDDEIEAMVDYCAERDLTLRFIETMPMGETGRAASDRYVDLGEVRARLEQRYTLLPGVMPGAGPARYVQLAGSETRIGFITPMSQHFCESCNRLRLGVDGAVYPCLGDEGKVELRPLLRGGANDQQLTDALLTALRNKPERHDFHSDQHQVVRFMSMTGG